jgi:hypothetical protein
MYRKCSSSHTLLHRSFPPIYYSRPKTNHTPLQSLLLRRPLESSQHILPDSIHLLVSVDRLRDPERCVVLQDRDGQAVVLLEPSNKRLGSVIGSLHQRLASGVILHTLLNGLPCSINLHRRRRLVGHVVRSATGLVDPTSANSLLQLRVVDLKFHNLGAVRGGVVSRVRDRERERERGLVTLLNGLVGRIKFTHTQAPSSASIASNALAWTSVLGNPSRINPWRQSG